MVAAIRVGRPHHPGRPRQKLVRVIADKAYDSDPQRKRLRQRGIELICPHKKNRVRPATQDDRALWQYKAALGRRTHQRLARLTERCAIACSHFLGPRCDGSCSAAHFRRTSKPSLPTIEFA